MSPHLGTNCPIPAAGFEPATFRDRLAIFHPGQWPSQIANASLAPHSGTAERSTVELDGEMLHKMIVVYKYYAMVSEKKLSFYGKAVGG